MNSYVVRVWLPDRPGALGQVASRIGAVRGDVVGIEILERGGGSAIDELVVALPADVTREQLLTEIALVDGVAIEDIRPIEPDRPDAGMVALQISATLVETAAETRLEHFCDRLRYMVDGTWAIAMTTEDGTILVERGLPPESQWLAAFFAGSRHLPSGDFGASAPGDVVWVHLDAAGVSVASGRSDRPFHARERQQVALLGRVADGLLAAALDRAKPLPVQ
ncbi:MAG TPA: hypothetical protein VGM78_04415 [Ilumatobacteraceae bacterium]